MNNFQIHKGKIPRESHMICNGQFAYVAEEVYCQSRTRSIQMKTRLIILLCAILLRGYVFNRRSDRKTVTYVNIEQAGKSRGKSVIQLGVELS